MPPEEQPHEQQDHPVEADGVEEEDMGDNGGLADEQRQREEEEEHVAMLDFFPLDEKELSLILKCYEQYYKDSSGGSSRSDNNSKLPTFDMIFHNMLSVDRDDSGGDDIHQNKNNDDQVSTDADTATLGRTSRMMKISVEEYRQRLQWSEDEFQTNSGLLMQLAIQNVFLIGTPHYNKYDQSTKWIFVEALSTLLGRRGSRGLVQILFQTASASATAASGAASFSSPSTSTETAAAPTSIAVPTMTRSSTVIDLLYRLLVAAHYVQTGMPSVRRPPPISWIRSLSSMSSAAGAATTSDSGDGGSNMVTMLEFKEWTQSVVPQVYQTLSTFCHVALFGPYHPFRSSVAPPLLFPNVISSSSGATATDGSSEGGGTAALWTLPFQSVPSSLALLSPNFGSDWIQLYSSDFDGFNFPTMQKNLLSYQGSTVIILQTKAGDCFGFYTSCPWKESKKWYGGPDGDGHFEMDHERDNNNRDRHYESFIFGIKPSLQYYGVEGDKPYRMFLHNPVYPHPGDVTGLAIGGVTEKTPRILITNTFENCKAGVMDSVYSSGPLLSENELFFDIDVIEAYAVNFSEQDYERAVKDGKARTVIREAARIKVASVDRTQFVDDFRTGAYHNHLFDHVKQCRGRHSFVAGEDESSGYYLKDKQPSMHVLVRTDGETLDDIPPCT
mmetsp:Transcript_31858/g.77371  ORF Transcript_31858/g.77371 Transcript_31858/m.77371 type:complete len:670 (+) Transcript_31858:368-2377(+)